MTKIISQNIVKIKLDDKKKRPLKIGTVFFRIFVICVLTVAITLKYFPDSISDNLWGATSSFSYASQKDEKDDIPHISIEIDSEDIEEWRRVFSENGSKNDLVAAKLYSNNDEINVKIAIKSSRLGFSQDNKRSFFIRTKRKAQLNGLRQFSLQNPDVRGFQTEAVINEVFRQYDIMTLNYMAMNYSQLEKGRSGFSRDFF